MLKKALFAAALALGFLTTAGHADATSISTSEGATADYYPECYPWQYCEGDPGFSPRSLPID